MCTSLVYQAAYTTGIYYTLSDSTIDEDFKLVVQNEAKICLSNCCIYLFNICTTEEVCNIG
jgi:hypothetical protein